MRGDIWRRDFGRAGKEAGSLSAKETKNGPAGRGLRPDAPYYVAVALRDLAQIDKSNIELHRVAENRAVPATRFCPGRALLRVHK